MGSKSYSDVSTTVSIVSVAFLISVSAFSYSGTKIVGANTRKHVLNASFIIWVIRSLVLPMTLVAIYSTAAISFKLELAMSTLASFPTEVTAMLATSAEISVNVSVLKLVPLLASVATSSAIC